VDSEHGPRLYTVKRDGSGGVELLRQRDVVSYLTEAERDPDSLVLTEQFPGCSDVVCITVLRRTSQSPSETWLCPYTQETVIPPGLRISTSGMGQRPTKVRHFHLQGCRDLILYGTLYSDFDFMVLKS